jgi:hypothetical protein
MLVIYNTNTCPQVIVCLSRNFVGQTRIFKQNCKKYSIWEYSFFKKKKKKKKKKRKKKEEEVSLKKIGIEIRVNCDVK